MAVLCMNIKVNYTNTGNTKFYKVIFSYAYECFIRVVKALADCSIRVFQFLCGSIYLLLLD